MATTMAQPKGLPNSPKAPRKHYQIAEDVVYMSVSFGVMGNSRKVKAEKAEDAPIAIPEPIDATTETTEATEATEPVVIATPEPITDEPLSNTIRVKTNADLTLLKVQKTLLESEKLKLITKHDGIMRAWLYGRGLEYDRGIMLMPIGLLPNVQAKLAEYETKRAELVEEFISEYYDLCIQAKTRLGSLYNPKDYPSSESIRAKFFFEWSYVSFGIPDELKNVDAKLYKQESEKVQKKMDETREFILGKLRADALDLVSHLAERLETGQDGKPKRLHATAVTELLDFLETFKFRNITHDSELDAVISKVKAMTGNVTVDKLRDDSTFKTELQAKLSTVKTQLMGLVESVPGRKIRKD